MTSGYEEIRSISRYEELSNSEQYVLYAYCDRPDLSDSDALWEAAIEIRADDLISKTTAIRKAREARKALVKRGLLEKNKDGRIIPSKRGYFIYQHECNRPIELKKLIKSYQEWAEELYFELKTSEKLVSRLTEEASDVDINPVRLFRALKFHDLINRICKKRFESGSYSDAIFAACRALISHVKKKSEIRNRDGSSLMSFVFSRNQPILKLNELQTDVEKDEQEGFMHLFMGVVKGIRNPKAHQEIEQTDPFRTLEYLSIVSLLAKRVDEAKKANV